MSKVELGSISTATMRAEDLIPVFVEELARIDTDKVYTDLIKEAREVKDYDSENADSILEELFCALDGFSLPYTYFGAHMGDGADYGFWPDVMSVEEDLRYGELPRYEDIPDDYTGISVDVSDHGNVTLYESIDGVATEIWSVV